MARIPSSHRARLTAVMTATSAVLLLILFLVALYWFDRIEMHRARAEVRPALAQALEEYNINPKRPNLGAIVKENPDISVTIFDKAGKRIAQAGVDRLGLLSDWGRISIHGESVVYSVRPFDHGTVVGSSRWTTRGRALRRDAIFLLFLYFPLVAIVALISWFSARSTFRPLERLSLQAEELSVENLSARLGEETGEYGPFAERLNRFLDRLESSVRREERFISDAAHELRTPLAVLRGRVETSLLRDRSGEEYKATLTEVLSETERLTGLVEMLLQSATLSEGSMEPLDLETNLERAHSRWVDRYTDKGVELRMDLQASHSKLLAREFDVIIDNLLSNALKVSPSGSVCSIDLKREDGMARIEVTDEGPGIPEEDREAIFARFTRLDEGRNRSEGGFGIGLAVCRRVAEGRSGAVFVSPSEKGAKFVVELPCA